MEMLCQLLDEKAGYFNEYEDATEKLLAVDIDEIETQMNRRQMLITKIDYVDARLRETAQAMDELSEAAWSAVRLQKAKSEIPENLWPVFERAQGVYAVANRIRLKEPLVIDRIEEELEGLSEKIKENNRSVSAKATRFSQAFQVGLGAGTPSRTRHI